MAAETLPAQTTTISVRLPTADVAHLRGVAAVTHRTMSEVIADALAGRSKRSAYPAAAILAHVIALLTKLDRSRTADPALIAELDRIIDRLAEPTLRQLL